MVGRAKPVRPCHRNVVETCYRDLVAIDLQHKDTNFSPLMQIFKSLFHLYQDISGHYRTLTDIGGHYTFGMYYLCTTKFTTEYTEFHRVINKPAAEGIKDSVRLLILSGAKKLITHNL